MHAWIGTTTAAYAEGFRAAWAPAFWFITTAIYDLGTALKGRAVDGFAESGM
jgi:hypothetical protein